MQLIQEKTGVSEDEIRKAIGHDGKDYEVRHYPS